MSVSVTRTWRDADALKEGKTVPNRWLVTVIARYGAAKDRKRFSVGVGSKYPGVRTEKQAEKVGETIHAELVAELKAKAEGRQTTVFETVVEEPTGETVSDWWGRYMRLAEQGRVGKKNRGKPQAAVDDRLARFAKYIQPAIGHLPMRAVTQTHMRKIVEHLDELIDLRTAFYSDEGDDARSGAKPGIAWKTGHHIWSECTSGFREATRSKIAELRVEGLVDPTKDVEPPKKTEERTQAALYPKEVLKLLACEDIPLSRRRVYAMAIYLGTRLSELARVTATDVDFEHGLVHIRGTKTQAARRRVPIEPTLLPLLKRLTQERPDGPLVDAPRPDGKGGASWLMKQDLGLAKITRADLLRDDAEQMPFTFHGCRHTAITHSYVAGRDATWLRIVYGHTDSEQTRRYLDQVALLRATFGRPFPELPPSVLGGATVIPLPRKSSAAG